MMKRSNINIIRPKPHGWCRWGLVASLCLGLGWPVVGMATEAAPRIATANLCVDQLVLRIADPDQIVSVHWLTRDPDDSLVAATAAQYPPNHGQAEELISLQPDMVFVGSYNSPVANMMMDTLGLDIISVQDPLNYEDIRSNITHIAGVLNQEARGRTIVAEFDRRLAQTKRALSHRKLKVLVFGSGGYSAGKPGLFHETLEHVGLINMAAIGTSSGWVPMTVEDVIMMRPDILILGDYRPDAPSMAGNIMQHPALFSLSRDVPVVHIPTRLWNCGTPALAEAATYLVDAINKLMAGSEEP